MEFNHKSVLLNETVDSLNIIKDGIYVDCTAGGGGHSAEILKRLEKGRLVAMDQDPDAIKFLTQKFIGDKRINIVKNNFSNLDVVLDELKIEKVDGILLDIGVSSYQLDTKERGFSYNHEALLDMRMSKEGLSARDVVNELSKDELFRIISKFGEEKYARYIARNIVKEREVNPINTTKDLQRIINNSVPYRDRRDKNPSRKTFQALRIFVNKELEVLEKALDVSFKRLKEEGRLAVITFHSLEDRIVKNKMKDLIKGCICSKELPICVCNNKPKAYLLNKRAIIPSKKEILENKRSRSAKLRVCVKI